MRETGLAPCSVNSPDEATGEYRHILLRLLAGQAYGELAAANFYASWVRSAPGSRERQVVAEIVHEEVEHWSGVIALMESLGVPDHKVKAYQGRQVAASIMHAITPCWHWSDAVMVAFLLDRAGYFMLEDYAESSYTPWAVLTRKTLAEEVEHSAAGQGFVAEQIEKLGRVRMQRALRKWWPIALNTFGCDRSRYHDNCIRLGFKRKGNAERRQRFRDDLEPRIRAVGLEVPRLIHSSFPYF